MVYAGHVFGIVVCVCQPYQQTPYCIWACDTRTTEQSLGSTSWGQAQNPLLLFAALHFAAFLLSLGLLQLNCSTCLYWLLIGPCCWWPNHLIWFSLILSILLCLRKVFLDFHPVILASSFLLYWYFYQLWDHGWNDHFFFFFFLWLITSGSHHQTFACLLFLVELLIGSIVF